MTRKILDWRDDRVIWEGEAETVKDALYAAIAARANLSWADLSWANLSWANLSGADLSWANLSGADLSGADLSRADLSGANLLRANLSWANLSWANLSGANLSGANLSRADLSGADLSGADLSGANLSWANLSGADLSGANLSGADLSGADLRSAGLTLIRDDLWAVLSSAPNEVAGLLAALREGRVDGSTYVGACACLVGTLANVRHCEVYAIPGLTPNSARPIERFFCGIRPGDTPETNAVSKLAAEWTEDWLTRMQATFGAQA
jgi:Pentapeptide repeats (8 copies)